MSNYHSFYLYIIAKKSRLSELPYDFVLRWNVTSNNPLLSLMQHEYYQPTILPSPHFQWVVNDMNVGEFLCCLTVFPEMPYSDSTHRQWHRTDNWPRFGLWLTEWTQGEVALTAMVKGTGWRQPAMNPHQREGWHWERFPNNLHWWYACIISQEVIFFFSFFLKHNKMWPNTENGILVENYLIFRGFNALSYGKKPLLNTYFRSWDISIWSYQSHATL